MEHSSQSQLSLRVPSRNKHSRAFSSSNLRSNSQNLGFESKIISDRNIRSNQNKQLNSKLVQFTQERQGDQKPRQLLLPIFFNKESSKETIAQKFIPPKPKKNLSAVLEDLRLKKPRKDSKSPNSTLEVQSQNISRDNYYIEESFTESVVYCGEEEAQTMSMNKTFKKPSMPMEFQEETRCGQVTTTAGSGFEGTDQIPKSFAWEDEFEFELGIRASGKLQMVPEFGEFPTMAFCPTCNKEVVTSVKAEKDKGEGKLRNLEWLVCYCTPTWLYRHQNLVHLCSFCSSVLSRQRFK